MDFVRRIEQTVAADPAGEWAFVADTLNVHWSAGLARWAAQTCGVDGPLGGEGKAGILENRVSRRAFLSDPSRRIRFVYLPKPSSWPNPIEVVFGVAMRKAIRRGSFSSVAQLEEALRHVLDHCHATMAHPLEWAYTGRPLQKHPPGRYCPPHRRQRPSKVKLAKLAL